MSAPVPPKWDEFAREATIVQKSASSAFALAYSTTFNERALEHPLYAPWFIILLGLVRTLQPFAVVNPQFPLYSVRKSKVTNDSQQTLPLSKENLAASRFPDFAIIIVALGFRLTQAGKGGSITSAHKMSTNWAESRVSNSRVSLLAEIKRFPSRHESNLEAFTKDLSVHMDEAVEDVVEQAAVAFDSQTSLDRVIAIAASGEWWIWTVLTRECIQGDIPSKVDSGRNEDKSDERETEVAAHSESSARPDRETQSDDGSKGVLPLLAKSIFTRGGRKKATRAEAHVARIKISQTAKQEGSIDRSGRLRGENRTRNLMIPAFQDALPKSKGEFTRMTKLDTGTRKMQKEHPPGRLELTKSLVPLSQGSDPHDIRHWSGFMHLGSVPSYQQLFLIQKLLLQEVESRDESNQAQIHYDL